METRDNELYFIDGIDWESFCHKCLKFRHQKDNYKQVDAVSYKPLDHRDKGDYGIDGFTATGIVYQFYFPERGYSEKKLYEHLYSKIRTDIHKLSENKDKLCILLNGVKINTWNFTTPKIVYSTDFHRLCNQYENDLKNENLSFVDEKFKIGFVDLDNLRPESNIFFKSYNQSINFTNQIPDNQTIEDYRINTENNYLVENALRKNSKLFPNNQSSIYTEKNIIEATNATIEDYLVGESIEKQWFEIVDSEYEKFLHLKKTLERRIKNESKRPFSDKNRRIEEIRAMLIEKLGKEFPVLLNEAGKEDLASSIVAEWLLNCSLDFI